MEKAECKDFKKPDEIREFPQGRLELIKIGGATVGRAVFDPGLEVVDVGPAAGEHEELRSPALPVPRLGDPADQDGRRDGVRLPPG